MHDYKWWPWSACKGEASPRDLNAASIAGPVLPCTGTQLVQNPLTRLCLFLTVSACARPEEMRAVIHDGRRGSEPTTVEIYRGQGRINAISCGDARLIVHGMSGVLDLGPLDSSLESFRRDTPLTKGTSSRADVPSRDSDDHLPLRSAEWPHDGWPHDALVGEAFYPSPDGLSLLTVRHTGPIILILSAPDVEGGFVRHEIPVRGASVKFVQWESAQRFVVVSYTDVFRVSVDADAINIESWKGSPIVAGSGRDVWVVEEHVQGHYIVVRHAGDASTNLFWNWESADWGDPVVLHATMDSPYVLTSSGTILYYDSRLIAFHPLLGENPSGAVLDFCVVNIDGNQTTFLLHASSNEWRVYRHISATAR